MIYDGMAWDSIRALGVYPTLKQAKARIKAVETGAEPGFEAVYYDVVKNFDAEAGADTMIALEG
jgi:hypothetical protein